VSLAVSEEPRVTAAAGDHRAGDAAGVALSVVVPSVNGLEDLLPCLAALAPETADVSLEVLVVDRCGPVVREAVQARYPWVRLLCAPAGTTIPALRAMAFAAARGRSVAVIEDHVLVPRGWARALLEAQRVAPVVGGAVENAACDRVVDWAAFLCEYSHCLSPLAAGPTTWVTGNNVVYPRSLLERYRHALAGDRWENHLHDTMHRDGVLLYCRPDIRVAHKKHYTVGEYLSQRYLYARSYAGGRAAGAGRVRRILLGAGAAALPPVLLWRIVTRVLAKRRHRRELAVALPLVALFVTAWAAGEVVGAWYGPGDALRRVC
jgi:hypothetical protein